MHAIALAMAVLVGPIDQPTETYRVKLLDLMILNGTRYVNFWDEDDDGLVSRGWCLMRSGEPIPFKTTTGWRYEWERYDGTRVTVHAPMFHTTWTTEDYEVRFRILGRGRVRNPIKR